MKPTRVTLARRVSHIENRCDGSERRAKARVQTLAFFILALHSAELYVILIWIENNNVTFRT
jgi:hypothetical protein